MASLILSVEARHALFRRNGAGALPGENLAIALGSLADIERAFAWVAPSRAVLRRAAEPFALPVRALDAIQLASALAARRRFGADLVLATHDVRMGTIARTLGFAVAGAEP